MDGKKAKLTHNHLFIATQSVTHQLRQSPPLDGEAKCNIKREDN